LKLTKLGKCLLLSRNSANPKIAESIQKECGDALTKTLPELKSTIKLFETIKKEDIDLVKTMRSPWEPIRLTLEVIAIINRPKPITIKDVTSPPG